MCDLMFQSFQSNKCFKTPFEKASKRQADKAEDVLKTVLCNNNKSSPSIKDECASFSVPVLWSEHYSTQEIPAVSLTSHSWKQLYLIDIIFR